MSNWVNNVVDKSEFILCLLTHYIGRGRTHWTVYLLLSKNKSPCHLTLSDDDGGLEFYAGFSLDINLWSLILMN